MRFYSPVLLLLLMVSCKKADRPANASLEEPGCAVPQAVHHGDVVDGRYIVAFDPASANGRVAPQQVAELGESVLQRNAIRTNALVDAFGGPVAGFVANLSAAELRRLRADPSIQLIEPDRIIALGNCFTVVAPWLVTWNIHRTGFGDGIGKTAWVLDTGIDFTHPDLTTDSARSRSFIAGVSSARDENGHGTHVAGIIGANNNNTGVLGVASGATLISLRVLDKNGEGLLSGIIRALAWVSVNGRAGDVVNMSIGEEGVSTILDQQVLSTASKGIFIAIAAGNDGVLASTTSPARVNGPNVYTVSAMDSTGKMADFSNYGNDVVDYAAPGVRVLSTYLNRRYAIMSGTSMAAPHLAGLLLLKGNAIVTGGYATGDRSGVPVAIAHR